MNTRFHTFDVAHLLDQGIEPLPEIRRRVAALGKDEGLRLVAPFLPSPLIEKLKGEGFEARLEHQQNGGWVVLFWRDAACG
jgi:hypothetical protein